MFGCNSMIDRSCGTSAGIARAHLFTWETTVAVSYTAFSLGTICMLSIRKLVSFASSRTGVGVPPTSSVRVLAVQIIERTVTP